MLVLYFTGITVLGLWFTRRTKSADRFMAAGRSIPGWAVGLTIFGSFVSSISFLAQPGKAFGGNWNAFCFALSLPLATVVAVRYFVPFYRKTGEISAYHHLEHRFGPWARTYAVLCYMVIQLTRSGVVIYLLSLALSALTGWDIWRIILASGVLMTIFPLLGGTEAVIWTGVAQSVVLAIGAVVCALTLLFGMPEGPGQLFRLAVENGKFSLGSTQFSAGSLRGLLASLAVPTVWVVLLYGLVENFKNFGVNQSYIQVYITARTDREAANSLWLVPLLFLPISAVFFFIGTALFAYHTAHPGWLPAEVAAAPDRVLPYYISHVLPAGLRGLIIAAICAAATDSNFNSIATLALRDLYQRYLRPRAGSGESLWVLRAATLASGVISTLVGFAMIRAQSALDAWWAITGIAGGAMVGLFLLGIMSRRATSRAAGLAVIVGVLCVLYMTVSLDSFATVMRRAIPNWGLPAWFQPYRSPIHEFMIPVIGTAVVLVVGFAGSLLSRQRQTQPGFEQTPNT